MFASFYVPHHSDRLPSSPVLGFSSVFVVDGGTAVQSQSSTRESPIKLVYLPGRTLWNQREDKAKQSLHGKPATKK